MSAQPLHERRRRLVAAREATIRDLGGLMVEMYKRNRFREELLLDKCEEIIAIEVEIAHVDQRLFQLAPTTRAGQRPIGRCECSAPILPGQNFCAVCGRGFGTLTQSRTCSTCGTGLRTSDAFCPGCGHETPDVMFGGEGVVGAIESAPGATHVESAARETASPDLTIPAEITGTITTSPVPEPPPRPTTDSGGAPELPSGSDAAPAPLHALEPTEDDEMSDEDLEALIRSMTSGSGGDADARAVDVEPAQHSTTNDAVTAPPEPAPMISFPEPSAPPIDAELAIAVALDAAAAIPAGARPAHDAPGDNRGRTARREAKRRRREAEQATKDEARMRKSQARARKQGGTSGPSGDGSDGTSGR